jgi:hypothetical protein
MVLEPMDAETYAALMAAKKEPAVGPVQCCGITLTVRSTVAVTMVVRCPTCSTVWEVLATDA